MNVDRFWNVIEQSCKPGEDSEDWRDSIIENLQRLEPGEIVAWGELFDQMTSKAYRNDLWGAAYLINGGASDDGFYYFRCWLVGMGRTVYEQALANPDSLADVVEPDDEYEAEIYGAAREAWIAATQADDDADFPTKPIREELPDDDWDFDDDSEMRRRLPRLAALYLDE